MGNGCHEENASALPSARRSVITSKAGIAVSDLPVTASKSPYMPCVLSMILRISFSCRAHFVANQRSTAAEDGVTDQPSNVALDSEVGCEWLICRLDFLP